MELLTSAEIDLIEETLPPEWRERSKNLQKKIMAAAAVDDDDIALPFTLHVLVRTLQEMTMAACLAAMKGDILGARALLGLDAEGSAEAGTATSPATFPLAAPISADPALSEKS